MHDEEKPGESYARKVVEGTKRFAQDLIDQNDRLSKLAARLENEVTRLEEEVQSLREKLALGEKEEEHLNKQLFEIEHEKERFSKEYAAVELQNSNLANLYVASYSLHATLNRDVVLSSIQEIIINLVGCEEIAIFDFDPDESELCLVASFGIDQARYERIPLGSGFIGRKAELGESYFREEGQDDAQAAEEPELSALVPLKVDGKLTGTIALFRLLQQKTGFAALDHELFDLLAIHAATALFCTGLYAKMSDNDERVA